MKIKDPLDVLLVRLAILAGIMIGLVALEILF